MGHFASIEFRLLKEDDQPAMPLCLQPRMIASRLLAFCLVSLVMQPRSLIAADLISFEQEALK